MCALLALFTNASCAMLDCMTSRLLGSASLVRLLGGWAGQGPAYRSLAAALRLLVLDGRVPLHVALPGERDLAAALGVSRTTVAAAYALLREEGFLASRQGSRSTTALPPGPAVAGTAWAGPGPVWPGPGAPGEGGVLDLAYASLPAPAGAVRQAYDAALAALPEHLPGHGYEPIGLPALRAAIAARYAARGLPTTPEQVLVTSGAQHALGLLVRLLAAPGDRVLVDHPTYPHALDTLRQAGCRLVPVGLPDAGWDVDGLRAAVRQTAPRMAYLVPDFHNPTGRLMDDATRAEVTRVARDGRVVLVVDETLVDLALAPPFAPAAAPVAAQAGGGQVVTLGSTSKSFWGGLRVGWIRADSVLVTRLAGARPTVDLGTPVVEQLAVTALLADAERVLTPRRETLRARRDALLALLAEHLPAWHAPVPAGGLSLWAELPSPVSTALAAAVERHGVRVAAGPRFGVDGAFERFVRLPFTLPEAELALAVERLAEAYNAPGRRSPEPAGRAALA